MAATSRREAITLGLALAAAPVAAASPSDAASAEAALRAFLHSFAWGDVAAMEAAFAPDATSFDGLTASANGTLPARDSMKRARGMPAGMRRAAETAKRENQGPPYLTVETIHDLLVQVVGDVAVCSFHFDDPERLGRRSIVLARRHGAWRILHLHASNLQL